MFTIFHVCELAGAAGGVGFGMAQGYKWFGWIGGIVGAVVGFFAGRILGRVPYGISSGILKRDLERCDVATLRARLDQEYYIAHLIIAHLVIRGEPIESFRNYVSGLLHSDCADRRRFGEGILRIWPEVAEPPTSPTTTFPALNPSQFAVAQAEVDTGIVLTTDGQRRYTGTGEMYRVFSSLDDARVFAREVVSTRTRVECGIYDSEQRHIETITAQS